MWKKHCRLNVSDGWKISQDSMIKLHIMPYLSENNFSEINAIDISKVIGASKLKHSPNMTKQIYLLLSKMFKDSVKLNIRKDSPVFSNFHCPKSKTKEAIYLIDNELEKLIEYSKYHWSIQAIVIQAYIGLRVGEVTGLQWKDIDFKSKTIHIRQKRNRKTKVFDQYTKNGKQFRVPIRGSLISFLRDVRKTMDPGPDDFVCSGPDGKSFMSYHSYQKALIYLCKGAGIKRISSHGFRHTCSGIWVNQGASTEDIKILFNHDSIVSTKTYMHNTNLHLQKIAGEVMKRKVA